MTEPIVPAGSTSRSLRSRLADGERVQGIIFALPFTLELEIAARCGIDFFVADLEHGPADYVHLQQHIALAAAHGCDVLVRTHAHDPSGISRVLDLGAAGLMFPHVGSRAEAEHLVALATYPPAGVRGLSTSTPAARYGRWSAAQTVADARERTLLIAMVETVEGVEDAHGIADVDGIDALFAGTVDLAASMGMPGAVGDPRVRELAHSVAPQARRAGKWVLEGAAGSTNGQFVVHNGTKLLTGAFERAFGTRET
ncbi:4-hydroxy-2-oxoheptanedioate aldolase [Acrocarpospora macrocephala]|uniref:2,4-dihydroxyhept-2-ene-1,7-dioic acid aldolase n=1 Tax=Acrocarpospora macrocephala TaxID=150177 RepID=A0A5M3WNS4_9ACTN|nr:aldolase/citrate lyase family protein [Acrocarpospora macrocephala]GES09722.1 2,4-dihydroxyhept-2-ene-1,7-dioic acid aldolase [Acrocarpospora macrocephala]